MNKDDKLKTQGKKRSSKWSSIRKKFLKDKICQVCGSKKKLEAHHIMPFHLFPEKELDEKNLIALCEEKKNGINCHLLIGHLGCFKSYNINALVDAMQWYKKIKSRP